MQMVMMVFRTSFEQEVLPLVEHEQLPYTRLDSVQGKGDTGVVPGSVTWGGSNSVLLVAVPDDRLNTFRERVRKFEAELEGQRGPSVFHFTSLSCLASSGSSHRRFSLFCLPYKPDRRMGTVHGVSNIARHILW